MVEQNLLSKEREIVYNNNNYTIRGYFSTSTTLTLVANDNKRGIEIEALEIIERATLKNGKKITLEDLKDYVRYSTQETMKFFENYSHTELKQKGLAIYINPLKQLESIEENKDEKIDTNELIDDLLGSNKPKSKNKHKQ